MFLIRLKKIFFTLQSLYLLRRFIFYKVLASSEHAYVLNLASFKTVVDVGANRGQFSLACRYFHPNSCIYAFEPLHWAAKVYRQVFLGDSAVNLYEVAISPASENLKLHVSKRDDSSSLLPIGKKQTLLFPGTELNHVLEVSTGPLSHYLGGESILEPALLKIDVQGFESEVLIGCDELLHKFSYVYCEMSFVELYDGQKLSDYVCAWMNEKSYRLLGIYNVAYADNGESIQADFLFQRR